MIDLVSVNQCTLCGACADCCQVGAISFRKEYRGNSYPQIDMERCVNCQRCEQVCPVLNPAKTAPDREPIGYAAMHVDDTVRYNSTSGGVFAALADEILAEGGYVCGAVLTDDLQVEHIVSREHSQIARMRGSKYVQSRMTGIYRQIEELVKKNTPVLFSGCPCQAAALKAFLGKDYPSLYTVDVICHGIPSVSAWKAYLSMQEEKHMAKAVSVSFREKRKGWHSSAMRMCFSNGKEYACPTTADTYFRGFYGNVTLKESCYHCAFREFKSGADLTLGDFWGAEVVLPDMDDNKGLSAVLVHTEKGRTLFEKAGVQKRPVELERILAGNRNLLESPPVSSIRESYYQYAESRGEEAAMKKHLCEPVCVGLKRKMRYALRYVKHAIRGEKTLY